MKLVVYSHKFSKAVAQAVYGASFLSSKYVSVLIFPPLSSFRRFLIHQLVEKSFSSDDLKTFSIGQNYGRRTVVCPSSLLEGRSRPTLISNGNMMTMVINKDVKNSAGSNQHSASSSSSRIKAMPPLTLYRPPAARNDSLKKCCPEPQGPSITNITTNTKSTPPSIHRAQIQTPTSVTNLARKLRRPDQQMYIPRARRPEVNLHINSCDTSSKQNSPQQPIAQTPISNNECLSKSPISLKRDNFRKEIVSSSSMKNVEALKNESNSPVLLAGETNAADLCNMSSRLTDSLQDLQKDSTSCVNGSLEQLNVATSTEVFTVKPNSVTSVFNNRTNSDNCSVVTNLEQNSCKVHSVSMNIIDQKDEVISVNGLKNVQIDESAVSNSNNNNNSKIKNDILYCSKRKEVSESECIENADHKTKQIHLIDSSSEIIENDLNTSSDIVSGSGELFSKSKTSTEKTMENKNKRLNFDESDWDTMFDDDGNCLDPNLLDELSKSVGDVKVCSTSSDYRSFQTTEERSNDGESIIEIYDFPAEFKTRDLLNIFAAYRNRAGFQLKWVNDTHALGVFSSPIVADEVLQCDLPCVKTRPLKLAIPESKVKARALLIALPPIERPKTCPALARRLVTGALGLRIPTDQKKREEEKLILKEARDQRRLAAKQREAAWEGTIGNVS